MSFVLSDRVKETSITQGTGPITLAGAVGGFVSFQSAIGEGNDTYYVIENDTRWEIGIGTYSSGQLSRDTVLSSSNGGAKINLNGVSFIFVALPADRTVLKQPDGNFSAGILPYSSGEYFLQEIRTNSASGVAISGTLQYQITKNTDDIIAVSGLNANDVATSGYFEYRADLNFNTINAVSGWADATFGNLYRIYDNVTSNFSMPDTSDIVFLDTTVAPINVYLPTATGKGGKQLTIKLKAGSNSGVLLASGSQTIDGQDQIGIYHRYQSFNLISDNSNWFLA